MTLSDLLLTVLIGLMALLYSSVGHAGSSGYQAAMALMGVSAAVMKPTALFLNLIVASIGTWQFACAGHINWRQWFWLVAASIPMAYLGGFFVLPTGWYYLLVAVVLWLAALRLWFSASFEKKWEGEAPAKAQALQNHPALLLCIGAILGFLSGLTGTGGGIFLTPLLVLFGWATPRQAAGISVAFILANSPAALAGMWQQRTIVLPELLPLWMILVAGCGWIGAWFGSRFGSPLLLRRLLAIVLVIAGAKLALTGLQ